MSSESLKRAYQNFWMGYEISDTKLRVFRFAFFAVFAIDAWLQIAHAPRYGAHDFNVGHFPWLDALLPMPSRPMMVIVFGLQAYLGVRLAFGSVSRAAYGAVAAFFAFGYYISQLNSLQHHYLLSMALCLIAAFPWPDLRTGSGELSPKEAKKQREKNWPVRMLLVSLSIMYFFAVVTKIDPLWLDGSTLKLELSAGWMRSICDTVGWGTVATLTLVVELALVGLLHIRRLWPLALLLGISMHMSFEHSGLEIGLFSYFMLTLYILVMPESWLERLGKLSRLLTPLHRAVEKLEGQQVSRWLIFAAAGVGGVGLVQLLPFDVLDALAIGVTLLAIADLAIHRRAATAAVTHIIAVLSLVAMLYTTEAVRDYYRFWGGQERRRGNISDAIIAYEDLVRFEPSYAPGHRRLGDLYRQSRRNDEAIEEYEIGLSYAPKDFALNKAAAQLYHLEGMGTEALRCAELAAEANEKDQAARRIRDHWRQKLGKDAKRP